MKTIIRSPFENPGFTVDQILAMKDELDRFKAELCLIKDSITRDYNRKRHVEQAIDCYTENIYMFDQSMN